MYSLFTCSVSIVELVDAMSLVNSSSQFIPGETFTFFEGKRAKTIKLKIKHDCEYWHVAFNILQYTHNPRNDNDNKLLPYISIYLFIYSSISTFICVFINSFSHSLTYSFIFPIYHCWLTCVAVKGSNAGYAGQLILKVDNRRNFNLLKKREREG